MANSVTNLKHVHEVTIRSTAERIWEALTQGELTRKYYYDTELKGSMKPGTEFVYDNPDGSLAADGRVLEVDRPHRLVMTFRMHWDPRALAEGYSRLTWLIVPEGDGCRLTVTHEELGQAGYETTSGGLAHILDGLKKLLEAEAA